MVYRIGPVPVRYSTSIGDALDEDQAPAATSRWERRLSIKRVGSAADR
jgi:hypothetical protein